jgi:hypothetical protein
MGRADVGRGGADADFGFIEAWAEHCPGDRPGAEHGSALFAPRWYITAKPKPVRRQDVRRIRPLACPAMRQRWRV